MSIILKLICEKLSSIAVKISFIRGDKHVYAAASVTSWYLRNDMQNFNSLILYMNIICIAQYLSGAGANFLNYKTLPSKHASIFTAII